MQRRDFLKITGAMFAGALANGQAAFVELPGARGGEKAICPALLVQPTPTAEAWALRFYDGGTWPEKTVAALAHPTDDPKIRRLIEFTRTGHVFREQLVRVPDNGIFYAWNRNNWFGYRYTYSNVIPPSEKMDRAWVLEYQLLMSRVHGQDVQGPYRYVVVPQLTVGGEVVFPEHEVIGRVAIATPFNGKLVEGVEWIWDSANLLRRTEIKPIVRTG